MCVPCARTYVRVCVLCAERGQSLRRSTGGAAGPARRSRSPVRGANLGGGVAGRPCARGDAGRLAGRVAVRVVPRGLVLGREGACVGVRRVSSGARGGVAAEQVARGRAVVFDSIGVPGGFWSQSGRKKPKKISFFSFFFSLSLPRPGHEQGEQQYFAIHNLHNLR